MAVGDIVPVPGARFEDTLESASPDLLREMIRAFAQRMMDAEVEGISSLALLALRSRLLSLSDASSCCSLSADQLRGQIEDVALELAGSAERAQERTAAETFGEVFHGICSFSREK